MTKKDLAHKIAADLDVPQLKVLAVVQRTLDDIIETLVREGRIELRNFGIFEVKQRRAREARNPRTGEKVMVPPRRVVTFKPGREMELRVNPGMDPEDSEGAPEPADEVEPPAPAAPEQGG